MNLLVYDETAFSLEFVDGALTLRSRLAEPPGELTLDFLGGRVGFRRRREEGRRLPLARAVGVHQTSGLSVLDATAGLGRDSFVLASLGCNLTLVERVPVVAALLADALARAARDEDVAPIVGRMTLIGANAVEYLRGLDKLAWPDVVYLDPMYPERVKSALVKKEMRFLRALAGDDLDAELLLATARLTAKKRVVVKRPKRAPPLPGGMPSHVIESENTRYDVYVVKS